MVLPVPSPDSVEKVLEMYNKEDGTFLIRESRSSEDSYTLSLCHSQRIKNFRISRDTDGSLSLRDPAGMTAEQPMKSFSSMAALVEHHKAEKVCWTGCHVICHVSRGQGVM